ncbi:unnamed protein product [Brassica oleracea]|uniref:(rape) hypothetical protein n=1 Tax=Brassica napus TaxID=3708 RepID=A0A816J503_BRANA|nr:unnamed protein product [Brassica napus]
MVKSSFKDLKKSMQNEGGKASWTNPARKLVVRLQSWILGDHGWSMSWNITCKHHIL